MSIFNEGVAAHEAKELEKVQSEQRQRDEEAAKQQAYVEGFRQATQSIVRPLFEEFAADAKAYGFPSAVEEGGEAPQSLYFTVRIIPEKGAQFGTNRSEECAYQLLCHPAIREVEHVIYYEQRVGNPKGILRQTYGLPSINPDLIGRKLREFLDKSLAARAEKPSR
ncbi:hypothetical protein P3T65_00895 [Pseudomonas nitroreducens]|uniref:hypothetical protein n=1 Tax=Pseudomonas nitroreducens TaxID=46680 RepID=UPI0023F61A46|nr:hypothetical protein [Pseudomonas nitroreducens]WEW98304.1 hypothetical protein P3T65_00895 [Pseudomonas nitroreducens]